MQKVTLGGERLGSGNKMKVEMNGYERSTHDLGYTLRTTMSAGTLVPFMVEVGLPGDSWDIDLECFMNTHPTIGPLFGSFKVQLDIFECPIRLYQGKLHNNALGIGLNMANVFLPVYELTVPQEDEGTPTDPDNSQVNPSSILAYLGVRGVGQNATSATPQDVSRTFNAVSWIAYWDIVKNYYASKQEEIGAVIHTPYNTVNPNTWEEVWTTGLAPVEIPKEPDSSPLLLPYGTELELYYTNAFGVPTPDTLLVNTNLYGWVPITSVATVINHDIPGSFYLVEITQNFPTLSITQWKAKTGRSVQKGAIEVATFPLVNLDTMRDELLSAVGSASPVNINSLGITPWDYILGDAYQPSLLSSQEGLAVKTYQSDLFNAWLNTETIDGPGGIQDITAVSTAGDSFTIDALNLANKVNRMLNRIAVSDGTYHSYIKTVYDIDKIRMAETPMYMGGLIKELVFQEVISQSQAEGGASQPLGTLAGKGVMSDKHKGGSVNIKLDEHAYIIGLISITPRVDYSQGNKWDVHLKTMDDFHKPQLDQIGFQELIMEQMAWWSTTADDDGSGGYEWNQKSAGKQPAWVNYMTNVNRTLGNFAIESDEMFMTLNRRYEYDDIGGQIQDMTMYIDPSKFNFIFAQTSLDSQNFWAQIGVNAIVRRVMSEKIMPNV